MKNFLSLTNYLPQGIRANLRHPRRALLIAWERFMSRLNSRYFGSYSLQSEDLSLARLLKGVKKGFYVDVGANDPNIISNTKYFYDRDWHGINIEPNPVLYEKLKKFRINDINLNIGVSYQQAELTFYQVVDPKFCGGSTFDKDLGEELEQKGFEIKKHFNIPVKPLSMVLEEHLNNRKIDFMSIDTEKFDLQVLQSNNWKKYRPTIVLVETYTNDDEITELMLQQGYRPVHRDSANTFFKDVL